MSGIVKRMKIKTKENYNNNGLVVKTRGRKSKESKMKKKI